MLEAEAEAKMHNIQSSASEVGGGKQLLSAGSFEHLNLLSSLNAANQSSSVLKAFNGLNVPSTAIAAADLENINPMVLLNGASTTASEYSSGLSKFGTMFKTSHSAASLPTGGPLHSSNTSDEDEMLLFSNSMLLETCLLKVCRSYLCIQLSV